MQWYLRAMGRYATFSGRARRKEYWFFVLFAMIFGAIAGFVDGMIGTFDRETGLGVVSGIVSLLHILPGLAVTVRRLHDCNWRGWWLLFPYLSVPMIALFAAAGSPELLLIVATLPLLWWLVLFVLLIWGGTDGPNRFGPDPLSADLSYGGGDSWTGPETGTSSGTSGSDRIAQIHELAQMNRDGILSDEEFAAAKTDILKGRPVGGV